MENEIWKSIKGYENLYWISSFGNVRSVRKYLKHEVRRGYHRVDLCKNGKTKKWFVHRLVAFAFIPNPKLKPFINHIDGNKSNNKIPNLEWVTNLENIRHAIKLGLRNSETWYGRAKLTIEQVREIRKRFKQGCGMQLAHEFNVSDTTIYRIVNKRIWKDY